MLKLVFAICVTAATTSAFSQKTDSAALSLRQNESLDIYRKALQYNDLPTAANAVTHYLYYGGNKNFRDTLALIYFEMNNLGGAYKMAKEQNEADPKNITALTLLAEVSSRAGETKTSLDWYEKLCPLKPEPYNYYQLATKQFVLERKLECKQSLAKVVADSASASQQKVSLEVGNGYAETVPVLAAAYNMQAVLAFQDKKTDEAKVLYGKALQAFPQFQIAKQNLDSMNPPAKTAPVKKSPK